MYLTITVSFLSIFISTGFSAPKLNVPKILLPFHSGKEPTKFELVVSNHGDDSCFFWKSTRPDVAAVEFKEPCSKEAIIRAISRDKKRVSSIILAEDQKTGFILKCDVIVDVIDKIEVQTTTKELYVDDAPEIFSIVAKNDQNDTFSSLNGLIFDWTLENLGGRSSKTILKFVNFEHSEYKGTEDIKGLERLGLKGDKVLVEGVGTGHAILSSKLMDTLYTEIESEKVDLAVVAHLLLDPAHDLYILSGSIVKFKTNIIKQGALHPLILNDTKVEQPYKFHVENEEICRINKDLSVTALSPGQTRLELIDENDDSSIGNLPSLTINVVEPFSVEISILPGSSWTLEVGRKYALAFKLLTHNFHGIYATEDIKFDSVIPSHYFNIDYQSVNGSYVVLTPKISGKTQISSRYKHLSTFEEVEIFDPIEMEPELAVFPPNNHEFSRYNYRIKVKGGSGLFSFSSSNRNVALISMDGFVEIGNDPGFAHLTISDSKNHLHKSVGKVVVSEVDSVKILGGPRNIEVGAILRLPVAAFSEVTLSPKKIVMYSNCSLLSYDIRPEISAVEVASSAGNTEANPGTCGSLFIRAKKIGNHDVIIFLNRSYGEPIKVEQKINVFPPLTVLDPKDELVLMVGSSWKVLTRGGPSPNPDIPKTYRAVAQCKDQGDIIDVENTTDFPNAPFLNDQNKGTINSFSVYCRKLGVTEIAFLISNGKSSVSNIPDSSTVRLKVQCVWPDRLSVKQASLVSDNCPTSNDFETLHYKVPTRMKLEAYDSQDKKLLNLSSSEINWKLESHSKNSKLFENIASLSERIEFVDDSAIVVMQFDFIPPAKIGIYRSLFSLSSFARNRLGIQHKLSHAPRTAFNAKFDDYLDLETKEINVFHHVENSVTLKIKGGSGHYKVEALDDQNEIAILSLKASELEIKARMPGSASFFINDLCIYRTNKTTLNVNVLGVANVRLNGPDVVEIGKNLTLSVTMISKDGRTLYGSAAKQMFNMRLDFNREFITCKDETSNNLMDSYRFTLLAKKLGSVDVFASVFIDGILLKSNIHSIQIFSPLLLLPKSVHMVIGSKYQLEHIGGPRHMKLEFSASDKSVAEIRHDGLIHALKLGQTEISGSFSSNGLLLSKDVIKLNVVNLAKVKINVRSTAIYNGTSITLFVDGFSKDGAPLNALSWTNTDASLKFSWSSDDANLLFGQALVSCVEDRFAVIFYANKPGLHTIRLRVTTATAGYSSNAIFVHGINELKDTIEILCLESPRFERMNKNIDETILITPNTGIRLEANRGKYPMSYRDIGSNSGIAILNSDLLKSSEGNGISIIQGDVQLSNNVNESFYFVVQVQPIHHIESYQQNTFQWDQPQHLPVGCTVEFLITGHTAFGDKFHASNLNLTVRPNRFDLAKLELNRKSSSLAVNFKTEGDISIQIFDESTRGYPTYLHLIAKRLIVSSPDSSLNVGDIMCLDYSMAADIEFQNQAWQTSNSLTIKLLTDSGVIAANTEGSVVISYSPNNLCSSKVHFDVNKITDLDFIVDEKRNLQSHGIYGDNSFDIPIILSSRSKMRPRKTIEPRCLAKIERLINTNPLIERWVNDPKFLVCHLSFSSENDLAGLDDQQNLRRLNIDLEPKFSIERDSYVCRVKFSQLSSKIAEEMSNFQNNATIFVSYKSLLPNSDPEIVKQANFVIYGPIFVRQSMIRLSKSDTSGKFLTVIGPRDLLSHIVLTSNTNGAVIFGKPVVNVSTNSLKIPYKLSKRPLTSHIKHSTESYVFTLSCTLTGQKIEIPVKFELQSEDFHKTSLWTFMQSLIDLYGSLLLVLSTAIATIICLFIGYKILYNNNDLLMDKNLVKLDGSHNSAMDKPNSENSALRTPDKILFRNLNQSGTPYLWSVNRSQQFSSSPR